MQKDAATPWFMLLVLIVTAIVLPAGACLWDNDTLRAEAKGLPGVAEIITGRFERNPPLYYQMRLEMSGKRVAANAHDWEAYDNAGVACDRLGLHTDAIEWMDRKNAAMDSASGDKASIGEHRYRHLANLGTFFAHRWFANGANREQPADLLRGIELIEDAIELNPDAHFGRERYQLLAMRWLLEPPETDVHAERGILELPMLFEANKQYRVAKQTSRPGSVLKESGLGDAAHGLTGLIALGNAWESVDVFFALAFALSDSHDAALSHLAKLRCIELIRNGKKSSYPSSPSGERLIALIEVFGYQSRDEDDIEAYFSKARDAADQWHANRTAFMLGRLNDGRHPDTDPTFWDGYSETDAPALPNGVLGYSRGVVFQFAPVIAIAAFVAIVAVLLMRLLRRSRFARTLAKAGP